MDNTNQVLYEKQLLNKQKELEHISQYDTLTNLRNRYSYNQFVENNKFSMKRQTGIIFDDMNGLKAANDEFGHLFGDSIIIGFADVLLKHFDRDKIFRISGDEFVVILEDINVVDFENKVREFEHEVEENSMAAVGYKWETTVVDLKQTIYQTEQLMMIQKQKYYVENSNVVSKHRPKILKGLIEELESKKFLVYLQPKAVLGSTKVIGAEALIRKIGENGQVIPPFEFVPVLEKEFLISRIDFFVLEEVCKMLQDWKRRGKQLIRISVNMSRVSIAETDFLEHIMAICNKYEIENKYLEFEITESIETKDDRKLPEIVSTLYELGFGVALDDMGSDYSSVKMLTLRGVDMVKIDRGLVVQIHDSEGAALIRYIIALCHEIGKKCIAEGVEDLEQAAILTDMGCDYYQGYLLDHPVPVSEFEKYLAPAAEHDALTL
ncbi:MAG: bifunctional diguanylate cyclase/phosphodiesterase [Lachnospiraceae bacterium]|nr:bifunctional diguanylate cyclase/phosphodiesterase [Lachnospiraceae bacterium]